MVTLVAVLVAAGVSLSWTSIVPGRATTTVERCAPSCVDVPMPRGATSWVDTQAPAGTTLTYRVRLKVKSQTFTSNTVTVTTPAAPPPPPAAVTIQEYRNISLHSEPVVSVRGDLAFSKGADVTQVRLSTGVMVRRDGIDPDIDPWHVYGSDGAAYYVSMALLRQPDGTRHGGLWVAKSLDDGLTWTALAPAVKYGDPVTLPDGTTRTLCNSAPDYPKIGIFDGVLHVSGWAQLQPCDSGSWYLLLARSADGGATWTRHTLPGLKTIEQFVGASGVVYALNRPDGLARSLDKGVTWTVLQPWTGKDPLPIRSAIALDPSGSLVLVWAAWANTSSTLWLSRSTDKGTTWSAPVRIDDGADGIARGEQLALAISTTGRLDLLWSRADTMWYSWLTPGQTWQHRQVGASGVYFVAHRQDYVGIASAGSVAIGVYAVAPTMLDTGSRLLLVRHP